VDESTPCLQERKVARLAALAAAEAEVAAAAAVAGVGASDVEAMEARPCLTLRKERERHFRVYEEAPGFGPGPLGREKLLSV